MAYLAVDLDVLEKCEHIGRACRATPGDVLAGLFRMWRWCWNEMADHVDGTQLDGFGLGGTELHVALVSFGFIEDHEGRCRVRGASRYTRVRRAQMESAARTNAMKRTADGTPDGLPHALPDGLPHALPDGLPTTDMSHQRSTARSTGRSTARSEIPSPPTPPSPLSTEHRASTGGDLCPPSVDEGAPEATNDQPKDDGPTTKSNGKVKEVFGYWTEKLGHPRARLDRKRGARIEWALKAYDEATCRLAIDGCAADPFSCGENDRHERYDDVSIIFRDAQHVEKFVEIAGRTKQAPEEPKLY